MMESTDTVRFATDTRIVPLDVWRVAVDGATVVVGADVRARMAASEAALDGALADGRTVYGVTTGYGPQARHHVAEERADELQRNLIYHLATGVGAPLSRSCTRAMLVARAANLARGCSAASADVFDALLAYLERDVLPVVPEMGTVGASGDLTPLAHVGLFMLGEGCATLAGEVMPAGDALARAGLRPVRFGRKDALALVNGTAAMTGIAALSATRAHRLWEFALRLGALHAELAAAFGEAYDPRLGEARPHPGQRLAHARLAELLRDSGRLRTASAATLDGELLQDAYSIRCLPQIFGAAADVLAFHDAIVTTELNAATDNPLVFADGAIVHGGNFFGQHVGYASDALAMVAINLAVHAERVVARICDPRENGGLPAFLHTPPSGINSGFMGAQVTASALVAEMRTLALAASVQSVPTNGSNQDVVPMGTIAARKTYRLLDLLAFVLAIEAIVLAEAMERRVERDDANDTFASSSRALVAWVRDRVGRLAGDRSLSAEIASLADVLDRTDWAWRTNA